MAILVWQSPTGVLTFVVLLFRRSVYPKPLPLSILNELPSLAASCWPHCKKSCSRWCGLLNGITTLVLRIFGIRTNVRISGALSKEELRTIVNESQSKISRRNQDMLISVLDLEKVTVEDIMVPRQ
ncbi:Putative Mg2+ and Co2+ transporter CorB [Serratia fonticola]|uniref:Mg2+ and Co2+ transporter CorB n=1 Tax=Serratia fonticola TaxID=47917 RepID=A0A4U9VM82_SERFO|nr:Putative Mg2+ and Co2+ transporter CorB [Serratia fonticola]